MKYEMEVFRKFIYLFGQNCPLEARWTIRCHKKMIFIKFTFTKADSFQLIFVISISAVWYEMEFSSRPKFVHSITFLASTKLSCDCLTGTSFKNFMYEQAAHG